MPRFIDPAKMQVRQRVEVVLATMVHLGAGDRGLAVGLAGTAMAMMALEDGMEREAFLVLCRESFDTAQAFAQVTAGPRKVTS